MFDSENKKCVSSVENCEAHSVKPALIIWGTRSGLSVEGITKIHRITLKITLKLMFSSVSKKLISLTRLTSFNGCCGVNYVDLIIKTDIAIRREDESGYQDV